MQAEPLVVAARPTAVVAAETTWEEFPRLWPTLLGEVWSAVRAQPESAPGRNVILYLDDVPHVEVGVEIDGTFAAAGRVTASELPPGRVVTAHADRLDGLDAAHHACTAHGGERIGPRWEVYGHQRNGAPVSVDVYYLLRA